MTERIFAFAQVADQAVLWILVVLSIISLGMILERFFFLRGISKQSAEVRSKVKEALQTHSLDDVEKMSKNQNTVEGRALGYAIKHIKESGSKGLEEAFNSFALVEKPELERFLSFLATVGSNAPYIGLLGTVLGIMKAFNDLASSAEAGQQTVMAGISVRCDSCCCLLQLFSTAGSWHIAKFRFCEGTVSRLRKKAGSLILWQ
jgi:biopolymer transport protein TolQ